MFCKECGAEVEDGVKFCPECGASLSTAVDTKQPKTEKNNEEKPINMGIALVISIILSGLGVAYAKNAKKGIVIFILFIIGFLISSGIGFVIWLYGLYATYIEVNHVNKTANAGIIEKIRVQGTPTKIILLIVFLVVISGVSNFALFLFDNGHNSSDNGLQPEFSNSINDVNISESEFKSLCKPIDYKQLTKNSDKYRGNRTVVTGEVVEIKEDANGGLIRLATSDGNDDIVAVIYSGSNDVVEGDKITVYGYVTKDYSYTSQANLHITIPGIDGKYIEKS